MKTRILIASIGLLTAGPVFATDYFTEEFSYNFDLNGLSLTFTPDGSTNFYSVTAEVITNLPSEVPENIAIPLSDDDSYRVNIPEPYIYFYGYGYSAMRIGSNGYITFNDSSGDYTPSIAEHFALPRIALYYTDLNPYRGGRVCYHTLSDRVVVTYENVPRFGSTNLLCNAQCEIFFYDNSIRLSWVDTDDMGYTITGLSRGEGSPDDYTATDLSAFYNPSEDIDEDGMKDLWEESYFGSMNSCNPSDDSDGDGYSNLAEFICGTVPNNALSHFQLNTYCQDDCAILNWNSVSGRTYRVTSTTNLTEQFTTISGALPYTQSSFTTGVEQARFFKVDINY